MKPCCCMFCDGALLELPGIPSRFKCACCGEIISGYSTKVTADQSKPRAKSIRPVAKQSTRKATKKQVKKASPPDLPPVVSPPS